MPRSLPRQPGEHPTAVRARSVVRALRRFGATPEEQRAAQAAPHLLSLLGKQQRPRPVGASAPGQRPAPDGARDAIQSEERDWLRTELAKAGVSTGIHYPRPVHLQPAYAGLGYEPGDFPVSERLARRFLSLPIFPELVAPQVARVASALIRRCEERHFRAADA